MQDFRFASVERPLVVTCFGGANRSQELESRSHEVLGICFPPRNSNKMKLLALALEEEPEDSVSHTHRINPRKSFLPAIRNCLASDSWIPAPGSS